VSRIELGQVGVRPLEVEAMLSFYGVSPEKRQQLVQFAAEARRKGWWWHEFRDLDQEPASKHMEYVDYEIAATSIQTYQTIVLGLFQTEDYARAIVRAARLDLSDEELERHVAFRMRRQKLLDQDELPELRVVLDEGSCTDASVGARPCSGNSSATSELPITRRSIYRFCHSTPASMRELTEASPSWATQNWALQAPPTGT
jgi:Domain of unknown function (DUF5753)